MLRIFWVGGLFFGTVPFITVIQFFLGSVSHRLWGAVSRSYYRLLCRAMRVRITIVGEMASGPLLLCANHVSWADIPVLGAVAPVVFIAKREVRSWPLIGAAASAQKTVFVDRERRQHTGGAVSEIAHRLGRGHSVVLFAEGTSSDGNRVLPFRSALIGAVEAACHDAGVRQVTVQPLAIAYTRQFGLPMGRQMRSLAAWYGDLDFMPHFAEFLRRGAVDVVISFGEPLPASVVTDRKAAAFSLENSVRAMAAATRRAGIPIPVRTR